MQPFFIAQSSGLGVQDIGFSVQRSGFRARGSGQRLIQERDQFNQRETPCRFYHGISRNFTEMKKGISEQSFSVSVTNSVLLRGEKACRALYKDLLASDSCPRHPAARSFNRERVSQENGSCWQGNIALLVYIGSASRSYREDATASSHMAVCGIGE